MPGPNKIYTYRPDDDPVTLASQFGITPNQLLQANPGGTPFSIGQSVNIPFQYAAPIGPQPAPAVAGLPPPPGYGPNYAPSIPSRTNQFGGTGSVPYGPAAPPGVTPAPNTPYMLGRGGGQMSYLPKGLNYQRQVPGTSGGQRTPGKGDFYGYERDPETGRSVRVVKNSATSNFLNEQRWNPQKGRYESIGSLLKQGKLDLSGNWYKQSRRQRRNDNSGAKQRQQKKLDFTLANSLISFGGGSG